MTNHNINDCKLINIKKIKDRRGNIAIVSNEFFLFEISRIFYLYDIPSGESRGGHAHLECHQFLIAASGSFEVEIFDGLDNKSVFLNDPNKGLHVPPGIWASENNFSSGSICLVFASHQYNESDYIRDKNQFLKHVQNTSTFRSTFN